MAEKLTDASCKSLPAGRNKKTGKPTRADYYDEHTSGLVLRVSPSGARSFSVLLRMPGQQDKTREPIGRLGKPWKDNEGNVRPLTLAQARIRAREILADAGRGVNPRAEREAARAARKKRAIEGDDFRALVERYLGAGGPSKRKGTVRPGTLEAYRRTLERDVLGPKDKPILGSMVPSEIRPEHIRKLVGDMAKRGAPTQANRTRAAISAVCSWAVREGILQDNPARIVSPPSKEKHRERDFSNDEIRRIFAAATGTELELFVPLLFHTGTRSEETRGMQWAHVDMDRKLWTIPGSSSKNEEAHPVPLSPGAMRIVETADERATGRLAVFPANTRRGYIDRPTKAIRALSVAAGFARWEGEGDKRMFVGELIRLHDIRRTVSNRLAIHGVRHEVREAMLGHTAGKLARTYLKPHVYLAAIREALDWWSAELVRILKGKATEQPAAEPGEFVTEMFFPNRLNG